MNRVLLFVGDRTCSVALWQDGSLVGRETFANSEEGRQAYLRYLSGIRHPEVALLADLVEEDYRIESLPPVGRRDRRLLEARRLEQYYRYTSLRNATRLGASTLFSALTNPNLVLPWISATTGMKVSVSGIASIAMLSASLVAHVPASHVLLLSIQEGTGLRQSFFLDGGLSFSRLALIHPEDDPVAVIRVETERIYKYLHMLNQIPERGAIIAIVLCSAQDAVRLKEVLEDSPSVHHLYFDLSEAARRVGYRGELSGSDALPVFLHLLGRARGANHYGGDEHVHLYRLNRLKTLAYVLSAASLLGGAAIAGVDALAGIRMHLDAGLSTARKDALMLQYRKSLSVREGGESAQKMKAAVVRSGRLAAAFPEPVKVMSEISRALGDFPEIRLENLSWRITRHPESAGARFEGVGEPGLYDPGARFQAAFIEGEIFPFGGDYREANRSVEGFCRALEREGMTVTRIKMPLDLDPGQSFAGRSGQAGGKPGFLLKAVRKAGS